MPGYTDCLSDVYEFDPDVNRWRNLTEVMLGEPPPAAYGAGSVAIQNKIFVFGGSCSDGKQPMCSITLKASYISATKIFSESLGISLRFRLVAGEYFDTLSEFDTTTYTWTSLNAFVKGDRPQARILMSFISINSKIYMYGGFRSGINHTC